MPRSGLWNVPSMEGLGVSILSLGLDDCTTLNSSATCRRSYWGTVKVGQDNRTRVVAECAFGAGRRLHDITKRNQVRRRAETRVDTCQKKVSDGLHEASDCWRLCESLWEPDYTIRIREPRFLVT